MTTMADLGSGIRIRHVTWNATGTIRIVGSVSAVQRDGGKFRDMEISDEGPVSPSDVEIITGGK